MLYFPFYGKINQCTTGHLHHRTFHFRRFGSVSREIASILTLCLCKQAYQFFQNFPFCRQPLAIPPISHQIKGIEGGFYEESLPEKVGTFSCGIPSSSAKSLFSLKYHSTQRCSCLFLSDQRARRVGLGIKGTWLECTLQKIGTGVPGQACSAVLPTQRC